jgi:hypothetical protein
VRSSFTLIELLAMFGLFLSAYAGYRLFGHWFDGTWNRVLGGFIGGFTFVAGMMACLYLQDRFAGMPYLPTCRNGCCRGEAYHLEKHNDRACWRCQCGDFYDRIGPRFVRLEGETEIPYLIYHPLKGWRPDQQS